MILTRDVKTPDMTGGKLVYGDLRFYTMEEAITPTKIKGESAIPAGKYKVIIDFSNKFKKHLPLLLDVPGFSGVRIHSGNVSVNRSDGTDDTDGCTLLGTVRAKASVTNSRYAMSVFMEALEKDLKGGKNVWLEVV